MAHHKRGRAKNRRAGCLFCKPHKANGAKDRDTRQEIEAKISESEQVSEVGGGDGEYDDDEAW